MDLTAVPPRNRLRLFGYTEVKGYDGAGEVVAEDNSELVDTGCNPDNW